MHEIMHLYFYKYFWDEYKNKFELSDEQIYTIKEAVTVILNLEFKDFEKVLKEACLYIKTI